MLQISHIDLNGKSWDGGDVERIPHEISTAQERRKRKVKVRAQQARRVSGSSSALIHKFQVLKSWKDALEDGTAKRRLGKSNTSPPPLLTESTVTNSPCSFHRPRVKKIPVLLLLSPIHNLPKLLGKKSGLSLSPV